MWKLKKDNYNVKQFTHKTSFNSWHKGKETLDSWYWLDYQLPTSLVEPCLLSHLVFRKPSTLTISSLSSAAVQKRGLRNGLFILEIMWLWMTVFMISWCDANSPLLCRSIGEVNKYQILQEGKILTTSSSWIITLRNFTLINIFAVPKHKKCFRSSPNQINQINWIPFGGRIL